MSHLVITVHGIRTFGDWQNRLKHQIDEHSQESISVHHFVYGYFSMAAFIIPVTRWLLVGRFKRELIALARRLQPTRIDIVAHSFGTHLVAWALRGLPPDEKLTIHTLVLAGSVLRSDFYWADLFPKRVTRVINDCGTRDLALIASQFLVPFTGMAGRAGFVGMTGPEFCNRYSLFGHSGYFRDAQGHSSDEYMSKRWLPLIVNDSSIESFDQRNAPTPWRGLSIWLTNNFEPIKLLLLLSPLIAALIWVSALYIEAKAAKERIQGVTKLGEVMRAEGDLPPSGVSLLESMQQALNIPLQRTYVLWVDDNSRNNDGERELQRQILGTFGFCFTLKENAAEALMTLKASPSKYSVVVSDFKRDRDPQAGYGLFTQMQKDKIQLPYIFYVANFSEKQAEDARAKGVQAEVTGAIRLMQELFKAVNPNVVRVGRPRLVLDYLFGCPEQ